MCPTLGEIFENNSCFSSMNVLNNYLWITVLGFVDRRISASFMYSVVKMWNSILEDGLEDFDEYAQYGLPLLKATALRYGFSNPIGNYSGTEFRYSAEGR